MDGVPLRGYNMAAGNEWKHLEFTLAISKAFFSSFEFANLHIDASLAMLAFQTSKKQAESMFSCTWHACEPDIFYVTHCEQI